MRMTLRVNLSMFVNGVIRVFNENKHMTNRFNGMLLSVLSFGNFYNSSKLLHFLVALCSVHVTQERNQQNDKVQALSGQYSSFTFFTQKIITFTKFPKEAEKTSGTSSCMRSISSQPRNSGTLRTVFNNRSPFSFARGIG